MPSGQHFLTRAASSSLLALSTILMLHAQTLPLAPAKLPAVGTVDERFQSYNVEMIELTGGRFWAPYKAVATAPADKSQPERAEPVPPRTTDQPEDKNG